MTEGVVYDPNQHVGMVADPEGKVTVITDEQMLEGIDRAVLVNYVGFSYMRVDSLTSTGQGSEAETTETQAFIRGAKACEAELHRRADLWSQAREMTDDLL